MGVSILSINFLLFWYYSAGKKYPPASSSCWSSLALQGASLLDVWEFFREAQVSRMTSSSGAPVVLGVGGSSDPSSMS